MKYLYRWVGLPIRLALVSMLLLIGPIVVVITLAIFHSDSDEDQWQREQMWDAARGIFEFIWGSEQ